MDEIIEHDVPIDYFKAASAPDVLLTYGLGPCFGLAVYDPIDRIGYLGHFSDMLGFRNALRRIMHVYQEREHLQIVVAGGNKRIVENESDIDYNREIERDWERVTRYLRKMNIPNHNIKVERLLEHGKGQDIGLDCGTGKVTITIDDLVL